MFRFPKITKQLLTFQTRLQVSIFQYWLTTSQPPLPMHTFQSLLLAKKISFTYSKPQAIRLMSQITTRKDLRLVYTSAKYHRELLSQTST